MHVAERDAVRRSHQILTERGLLVGCSTGHVLHAIAQDADTFQETSVVVGVSADLGDKYLDTVYDQQWLAANFPELAERTPGSLTGAGRPGPPLCGPLREVLDGRRPEREPGPEQRTAAVRAVHDPVPWME